MTNSNDTIQIITNTLKQLDISLNDFVESSWAIELLSNKLGVIKLVHSELSFIDIDTRVWYFEKYNIYLQLSAYNSSWSDADWNEEIFEEVFPEEKTIIVYKKNK